MISLWITRHFAVGFYVADSWDGGGRAADGYDTYIDLGAFASWTFSW